MVSRQALKRSHLCSSTVPLINKSLKTFFQVLTGCTFTEKVSTHIFFAVFYKLLKQYRHVQNQDILRIQEDETLIIYITSFTQMIRNRNHAVLSNFE